MNVLVARFSAMGDVALLTPALIAVAAKYPTLQITLVTRGNYTPFFYNIPNVHVLGINLKKYRGFLGLWRLFKDLKKLGPYTKFIDLHSSLRTKIFKFFFKLHGVSTYTIVKGRREKHLQTRRKNKLMTRLPHTVDRYLNVFAKAGFPATPRKGPWINVDSESKLFASDYFKSIGIGKKDTMWIGFAPFAGHKLKEWPHYKSKNLIQLIKSEFNAKIFLFGSKEEKSILLELIGDTPDCYIVSGGKLGIKGEIGIMEKLDVMVGMDSSNVHIMALLKKPVIGLYGTTHPMSGFGPYAQEDVGVLQIENLPCRPCSIFGDTECYRKDFACMELIDPMDVIRRIKLILNINTLW
ncbi:MAG: glycosyltransferase family 9 protein [Leptospiraceae bacterium]|nr:glycosyltransferase family 9 protein [Leptospiraceae bacterium]MCK6381946.1 glycosyltransferase family 9 protein [Leptospiraceae bacterium]NUM41819.1 glycosyltransferase family 9 protein [Leptospiraceae bacterium]